MPASAENVLLKGLDERWKKYQAQFKACRREFSEGAVHDLRVGARRLLGVFDILGAVDSHRGIQKARRAVKKLLDHLDELRDVQVLLIEISKPPEPWTQLSLFQAELEKRQHQLMRRARQSIRASSSAEIRKRIEKMRTGLAKHARQPEFAARLLQAADGLYLWAAQAAAHIDTQPTTGLHRARIAFKRFRYVTEIIGPLAPHYPKAHFKSMHDFQSAMGDIRDVEIFLSALTAFS